MTLAMAVVALTYAANASESDCFRIQDKDARNACLGATKTDSSYCFKIQGKNERYACLAETKGDRSYCFKIMDDKDLQNACLAKTPR